jgi:hypothetical protein
VEIESAVVENVSANEKKAFQVPPKGLLTGKNLYIKNPDLSPEIYQLLFLNPGKEDDRRGNPTPYLDTREFFVKPGAKLAVSPHGIFLSRMLKKQAVDFG